MTDLTTVGEAALDLARKGFRVLPLYEPDPARPSGCSCHKAECGSVAKHPRPDHGVKEASADPAEINQWWARWPNANIGIAAGDGLVVLDVDPRNDGDSSLEELENEHGEIVTLTSRTGGGGWHFYFRGALPARDGFRSGLDLKSAGGLVVAPASLHESGERYRWVDGRGPDDIKMIDAPPWLTEMVRASKPPAGPAEPLPDTIPEGSRNDTLYRFAATIGRRGGSAGSILAALRVENETKCVPPLADAELVRIASSGARPPPTAFEAPDPVVARVRCLADVAPEEVTWLWDSRIPRGKLSEIVGDPGVGKSTLVIEIVAALTTGRPLPGEDPAGGRAPITVLLLSAEDGAGDTILPRLVRAKADLDRVHIFDGIASPDGGTTPLNLRDPAHRRQLAETIERLAVGLLVIDPLAAYLGGIDSHRDADVRGVLAPLAELADSSGCAILSIRHLNKGSTSRAIYRAGGSIGFTAAVRSSMLVGRMDEESDERALVTLKSNLAAPAPPVGFSLEGGLFRWTGTPDVGASDLLRPDADSDERGDRKVTEKWLLDALRDGPIEAAEVFERAGAELSVSPITVKRAKSALGDAVEAERESLGNTGGGRWLWRLARVSPPPEPLAKPEFDTLARTVVPQGFPAPDGPRNPQGYQVNVSDTLAKSEDLFEGLDDAPSV